MVGTIPGTVSSGSGGLASQNDLRALFGLGDATNLDTVRVEWPSGLVQELTNVAARQFVTLREASRLRGQGLSQGEFSVSLEMGKGLTYPLKLRRIVLPGPLQMC